MSLPADDDAAKFEKLKEARVALLDKLMLHGWFTATARRETPNESSLTLTPRGRAMFNELRAFADKFGPLENADRIAFWQIVENFTESN